MSNMIGKSGVDWSECVDASYYKSGLFYKVIGGDWHYWGGSVVWMPSSNCNSWFNDALSKEEDLQMNVKTKVVKGIEDLEVGMFLYNNINKYCVLGVTGGKVDSIILTGSIHNTYNSSFDCFDLWSYTYNGEYTPIVKETEAEKKIKELEATIALAQKQLEEYKDMK